MEILFLTQIQEILHLVRIPVLGGKLIFNFLLTQIQKVKFQYNDINYVETSIDLTSTTVSSTGSYAINSEDNIILDSGDGNSTVLKDNGNEYGGFKTDSNNNLIIYSTVQKEIKLNVSDDSLNELNCLKMDSTYNGRVKFTDGFIELANNTLESNNIGFYGKHRFDTEIPGPRYGGLIYNYNSGNWTLFTQSTQIPSSTNLNLDFLNRILAY